MTFSCTNSYGLVSSLHFNTWELTHNIKTCKEVRNQFFHLQSAEHNLKSFACKMSLLEYGDS